MPVEEEPSEPPPAESLLAIIAAKALARLTQAASGILLGNAVATCIAFCALGAFWVLQLALVPPELHVMPAFLQYPTAPNGTAVASDQAACANVSLTHLPAGSFSLDVNLLLSVPPPQETSRQGYVEHGVVMCALELLTASRAELASSSRPLLLPKPHWLFETASLAVRWPLVLLGWEDERVHASLTLLENVQMPRPTFSSLSTAHVCLRPPVPTYSVAVQFNLRIVGPLRLVQRYPWICSTVIVVVAASISWSIMGCLGLVLMLGRWQASGAECNASRAEQRSPRKSQDGAARDGAAAMPSKVLTSATAVDELDDIRPEVLAAAFGLASGLADASVGGASSSGCAMPESKVFTGVRRRLP